MLSDIQIISNIELLIKIRNSPGHYNIEILEYMLDRAKCWPDIDMEWLWWTLSNIMYNRKRADWFTPKHNLYYDWFTPEQNLYYEFANNAELVELVQKAAEEALPFYKAGEQIKIAGLAADGVFDRAKRKMPHTLGHGIGLEIHEFPRVRSKQAPEVMFEPGMIVTLEPGLYDPSLGGVRLENDVLITETGNEVITHSRIIYR